ncbi:carbonic anhydrase [Hymenopellis radicata]|nr:carbonic anhydrase [Hymenopellis radicata]
MSDHPIITDILASNAQWAADVDEAEPEFFTQLAKGQQPPVLWIGCSDSRVPESVITGSRPGTLFVLRNIANQFHLDDDSALSALTYAIDHLGCEHVVVVGHTECGGCSACFAACPGYVAGVPTVTVPGLSSDDPINRWLDPVTALAASLHLSSAPKEEALPILVEENVKLQVDNVCMAPAIVNAWANKSAKGKDIFVHGWVFDLGTGKLNDLGISRGPQNVC